MADYCGMVRNKIKVKGREALGDFLQHYEELEPGLGVDELVPLGICEGHGAYCLIHVATDGSTWLIHAPCSKEDAKQPAPVLVGQVEEKAAADRSGVEDFMAFVAKERSKEG